MEDGGRFEMIALRDSSSPSAGDAAARRRTSWGRFRRRTGLAAAAAVVLAAAIAGGVLLRSIRTAPAELTLGDRVSPELLDRLIGPSHGLDFSSLGAARAVDRTQISREIQRASFTPIAPETLPNGYVFDGAWVISCDTCRMVCLRYRRDGQFLAVLQGPSGGRTICNLASPQCCLMAGMACRRSRVDRVEVVQTTHGNLALMLAVPAGEADVEALMASLSRPASETGKTGGGPPME